jgi:hypothetical protein
MTAPVAAGLCEAADRWRPQRGDPVEPGGLGNLLDPRLRTSSRLAPGWINPFAGLLKVPGPVLFEPLYALMT